ncbi:MAG: multidrug resistance efflux transporter family protein [Oscillospiraceae bacterium]|nr:multidrug resistance efflux transporter family protein [Oscillospiraceae bacterium]
MLKPLLYGVLASLFFAFAFIFNRSMDLGGGYWMWSGCLRFFLMLPMLWAVLAVQGKGRVRAVLQDVRRRPVPWLLWSTVGFGLFYLPLTMASAYGESWLVAALWQVTIVAGVLLTPLFGQKIPVKNILMSLVILAGIFLLQADHWTSSGIWGSAMALIPILIAAFSYPLGNRKMMQHCPDSLDTAQRVFGMTLCSMPFWLLAAAVAWAVSGPPGGGQVAQSAIVALFSGVIATILFFHATDLVRHDRKKLAVVEATQCGEVIFTLLGGVFFLHDAAPSLVAGLGLLVIIVGMVCNSLVSTK